MVTDEPDDSWLIPLPDHTQLPEVNGTFAEDLLAHPQSLLLTDSLGPVLERLHPEGNFAIGQDSGIYWRQAEPPERGAVAPDWFYVPGVPATLDGLSRRSYVLWKEFLAPLIVLEFVSGTGAEERDRTPMSGKFWVYENVIRPGYYGIYEVEKARVELYRHVVNQFERVEANEHGRYPIVGLGVELGIWQGTYQNLELPWMRWWDANGILLPTGHELAEVEADRANRETRRADQLSDRADRLAAQLRALGIEPEA